MAQKLVLIAAIGPKRVIGRDNQLPWKIPRDMKFFKKTTIGHAVIMGRKTFESLGSKPLPKRTNIIVTRNPHYEAKGCLVANSLEDAINKAPLHETVFVIGGGELYKIALEVASEAIITEINDEHPNLNLFEPFPGDTYFPELSDSDWEVVHDKRKFVAADRFPPDRLRKFKINGTETEITCNRSLYFRIRKFVRKAKAPDHPSH